MADGYFIVETMERFRLASTANKLAKSHSRITGDTYTVRQSVTGGVSPGKVTARFRAGKRVKSNPSEGRMATKREKKEKARKASAKRRIAVALAKYLRQVNPAAVGARVQKLKGGVIKITPIKKRAAV